MKYLIVVSKSRSHMEVQNESSPSTGSLIRHLNSDITTSHGQVVCGAGGGQTYLISPLQVVPLLGQLICGQLPLKT